ncbi:uncharacterized protein LOC127840322 isoform X3 [Dreissena polymorpha]|uniref:uncharacterized protein LOC127840322 isoform X3 n=1 Tax=Dreissena polymorpha TaxID=45954 RepID=UPI002264E03B|nr:uncharacterized protein LOC127840322 isoform X3 [Dreissena polymorpha]
MSLSQEDVDEYKSSLKDLNFNSKPLINMLTMLAEDHEHHAPEIVSVIEEHLAKCKPEKKLPVLYLMDSIMKNLGTTSYKSLFTKNIVNTFTTVFEQVDEKTRASMYKLRQTWSVMLPNQKLYMIDVKIKSLLDPAWPITATPEKASIHVNPKFLQGSSEGERSSPEMQSSPELDAEMEEAEMRQKLIAKQQELLKLQEARLELELAEAAEKLKQKKMLPTKAAGLPLPQVVDLPESAPLRDPRQRPTDPRLRDPRLSKASESGSHSSGPQIGPIQSPPSSATITISSVPAGPGIQQSASFTAYPEGHGHGPVTDVFHYPGHVGTAHTLGHIHGHGHGHPFTQGRGPWPPFSAPSQTGQSFKGEVYSPEPAKFSDDNDSDASSRSSGQEFRQNHDPRKQYSQHSDPSSMDQNKQRLKPVSSNSKREETVSKGYEQNELIEPDSKSSSSSVKWTSANFREKYSSHIKQSKKSPIENSNKSRDPRKQSQDIPNSFTDQNLDGSSSHQTISRVSETKIESSKSKKAESNKSTHSHSFVHKSSSDSQRSKSRSVSKERESKSETKLKDTSQTKQTKTDNRPKDYGRTKDSVFEKKSDGASRERDVLPHRRSSPQQHSSKESPRHSSGVETKETEAKPQSSGKSNKSRITDETSRPSSKTRKSDPGPVPRKVSPKSDVSKRTSSSNVVFLAKASKSDTKIKTEVVSDDKSVHKGQGKDHEKRARSKELDEIKSSAKKIKLDNVSSDSEYFSDGNMPEENFPEEFDAEKGESAHPPMDFDKNEVKLEIEDDISDLFGGEDEDFRSQQLPLKSPSSKSWDQYKADRSDMFAEDITRKKMRRESVVHPKPSRGLVEPEDIDFRVGQLEPEQTSPTIEISAGQHSEILLQAHKRLTEGKITQEQHQELISQLNQLVQIRQLQQQEDRRLSSEFLQASDAVRTESESSIASETPSDQNKREIRSPDRPLDKFRIPKKSLDRKASDDEPMKGLSNLYPEAPALDFRGQGSADRQEVVHPRDLPDNGKSKIDDAVQKPDTDGFAHRNISVRADVPEKREYEERTSKFRHKPYEDVDDIQQRLPDAEDKNFRSDFEQGGPSDLRLEGPINKRYEGRFNIPDGPPDLRLDGPMDHWHDGPPGMRIDGPPNLDIRRDGPTGREWEGRHRISSDGPPDMRRDGPLEMRRDGPPGREWEVPHGMRRDGPPDMRRDGPPDMRRDGPPDLRRDGPPDMRRDGPPDMRRDGPPDMRRDGPPDMRKDGPPDMRRDGPPDMRQDGPPDMRRDGPPGKDWEGPHGMRRDGPIDARRDGPPDMRRDGPPGREWEGPHGREWEGPPGMRRDFPPNIRRDGPIDARRDGPPDMRRDGPQGREWEGPLGREWEGPPDMRRDGPPDMRRDGPPDMRRDGPPDMRRDGPSDMRRDGPPDMRRDGPPDMRRDGPLEMRQDGPPDMRRNGPPDMRRDGPIGREWDGPPGRRFEGPEEHPDRRRDFPPDIEGDWPQDMGHDAPWNERGRGGFGRRGRGRGRYGNDRREFPESGNWESRTGQMDTPVSDRLRGDDIPPYEKSGPHKRWFDESEDRNVMNPHSPKKKPLLQDPDMDLRPAPWGEHGKPRDADRRRGPDEPPLFEDRLGPHAERRHEEFHPHGERRPDRSRQDEMQAGDMRHPQERLRGRGRGRFDDRIGEGQRGGMIGHRGNGPRMEFANFDNRVIPDMKPVGANELESFEDRFGDPRFRCFKDMGPQVNEEVVLGKRNFEIKLGAPPRRIMWDKNVFIEVFADPAKRGVVIDGNLVYKFGERVKEITVRGRKEKIFYLGKPVNIWIDGQLFEVRVDAPPKHIETGSKTHKVQIDGRDMMILIDKHEMCKYGGEPRFVFLDEERVELRFDPPPRTILIDGKLCELKLNTQQPCVNINGVLHGIRFDGPPRDVFIDGKLYQIFTDHAVKLRIGNKYHYVALGGPCHEIIVDGRWFELKFNEPPKEIVLGNYSLMVKLPNKPPEVKILPPLGSMHPPVMMPPGGHMMHPGLMPGPIRPHAGPMAPMGPPGMMRPGINVSMPAATMAPIVSIQPPALSSMTLPTPSHIPGLGPALSGPSSQPSGLSNVFSTLFGAPHPAAPSAVPALPVDINSLLDNLVKTGLIKKEAESTTSTSEAAPQPCQTPAPGPATEKRQPELFEDIPDMTELDVVAMKSLHKGAVQRLYSGVQCTSCGQRFNIDDDQLDKIYRKHLDWHFRQNRKEKDEVKVTRCRKWFYGEEDWVQYEEVVDEEEAEKSNFFEKQQPDATKTPARNNLSLLSLPEGATVVKCPQASGNDVEDMCNICHEPFEQFWDEEVEEWRLRDAIKVNNKTYHPICFEDHTDASEGTPSPSVLTSSVEPDFIVRKTLTYEESSQDGQHASFEDERKIIAAVKPEPDMSDNESASRPTSVQEPVFSIKQEPLESDIVSHSSYAVDTKLDEADRPPVFKKEPLETELENDAISSSSSFLTFSSKPSKSIPFLDDVKQEPMETRDAVDSTSYDETADTVNSDPPEVPCEQTEETMDTNEGTIKPHQEIGNSHRVKSPVNTEHLAEESDDISGSHESHSLSPANKAATDNMLPNIADEDEHSVSHDCNESERSKTLSDEVNLTLNTPTVYLDKHVLECSPEMTSETDKVPTRQDDDDEPSLPSVLTQGSLDVSRPSTSISPRSFSLLSVANLAVRPEPVEITQEMLDIDSNASTPTHDELPDPENEML